MTAIVLTIDDSVATAHRLGIVHGALRDSPRKDRVGRLNQRQQGLLAGQVAGEVLDHVARIILSAVDETGLTTSEHRETDGVETRGVDHAAVVAQAPFSIEHRHIEPAVVRAKTGRPHDRADRAAGQVQFEP